MRCWHQQRLHSSIALKTLEEFAVMGQLMDWLYPPATRVVLNQKLSFVRLTTTQKPPHHQLCAFLDSAIRSSLELRRRALPFFRYKRQKDKRLVRRWLKFELVRRQLLQLRHPLSPFLDRRSPATCA
jgi:hypothetical protein